MSTSFSPTAGYIALPYDGGLVLIDRTGRQLEVHNEGTAQLWNALAQGLPLDLVLDHVETSAGRAARNAASALAERWSTPAVPIHGDELPKPEGVLPQNPSGSPVQWIAATPGAMIALEAGDEVLAEWLKRLLPFDHQATGEPRASLRVTRAGAARRLEQDGMEVLRTDDGNLLQGAIYQACLELAHDRPQWRALIHGAAVARDGRAIGLPARSGSGKSTLTAWLVAQGFTYLSDDLLAILADGRVAPWPTPVSVKPGSMAILSEAFPGLADGPERQSKGVMTRLLPLTPEQCAQAPVPLDALVFPTWDQQGTGELRPIRPLDALARLASDRLWLGYPLQPDNVAEFLEWLAATPTWELRYASLDAAHAALNALLAQRAG